MPQNQRQPTNQPHGEPHPVQPVPTPRPRLAGRWYYVVVVGTAGVFAWVPFLHAAVRLGTARARRLAVLIGGLDAGLYVLLALTPQDSQGQATSGPISTIGGLLALGLIIVGCVLVAPLRRMAYEGTPTDAVDEQAPVDPAISAALAARARRDEARQLAADDPLLARELHIGRPDLPRTYDDGGLVDLNSAPAEVIAKACDVPAGVATAIVSTRESRGEPFTNVDELFVLADLPVATWDRIRDRAVLLS